VHTNANGRSKPVFTAVGGEALLQCDGAAHSVFRTVEGGGHAVSGAPPSGFGGRADQVIEQACSTNAGNS
jgi:hypothetical protein